MKQLEDNIKSFEFYQALRRIHKSMLGTDAQLTLSAYPDLAFPATELRKFSIERDSSDVAHYELLVNFIGLVGQSGALPEPYTELLLERLYAKDKTLLDFLSIFEHRLLQLFYDGGTASNYYMNYEVGLPHQTTDLLQAFTGQKPEESSEPSMYYAGLFGTQARSAEGLRVILSDHFDFAFNVLQYTPQWFDLPADDCGKMSKHNRLGGGTILGKRVWQVQNRCSILIGPLDYTQFTHLLPCGDTLGALTKLINAYLGLEYDYVIQLLVSTTEFPICQLSKSKTIKLGWNSRLAKSQNDGTYTTITLAALRG
jgi:type VI secretion system protein ImpH